MVKVIKIIIFAVAFSIFTGMASAQDLGLNIDTDNVTEVVLNADKVSFNDETGEAVAEGNALLTYGDTTITAERIEYNSDTQKVKAMPLPNQQVVLKNGNRSIKGDQLDYDLVNQEGVLSSAHSSLAVGEGVLYVYGNEITVIPWELAEERGLVRGNAQGYVAEWKNVTMTTCALEHPHYRLVSKSVSFLPGRSVTAKSPHVYLGNMYIFTSPFDYVVELKRRAVKYSLWPYFQKSDRRGTGGGFTASAGWDGGKAALDFAWADKAGVEWGFEIEQELSPQYEIEAGFKYTWDDLWDDKQWNNGWRSELRYSKNEYISDQKDSSYEYKGRLTREPEFTILTPYYRISPYSYLMLDASFGSYNETVYQGSSTRTLRYGLGFHNYFEMPVDANGTELFANVTGEAWRYDRDSAHQEFVNIFTGFRYKLGSVELGTAYEKIYRWGQTAMQWDEIRKRERVHQKIRFPIGKEFYTYFRGSYDLYENMLDETIYGLQWVTDCMIWDLYYRRDKTSGGDNQIGLTLSLRAFPDNRTSLGQAEVKDPFLRPSDLPKK